MDLMQRRRELLGMQSGSVLPAEYQQVEWINGAGCDVDLLYVPTVKPKVLTRFAATASGDRDMMGFARNTVPSFIIDCYNNGNPPNVSTNWFNRYYSTTAYSFTFSFTSYNDAHDFEFGQTVAVDGNVYNTLSDGDWSNNTQSFHIFAGRTSHPGIKMYNFKLYDGDALVRNLIPCYRKSDSVIGMYDNVSKQFFTSAVGIFTKGPDI